MRRPVVLLCVCVSLLALAACSNGAGSSGDQGFVGGKGVITLLGEKERKAPGPVTGETLEGKQVSLADYRGKVVVMNVWGSWCAPCRGEANYLKVAAEELQPKGVVFLGINTRDPSPAPAVAFEKKFEVPYTSIYDQGGKTLLAFRGTLPPQAIPSTVIIDADGRVAASIIGAVTSSRTLVDLIGDVRG